MHSAVLGMILLLLAGVLNAGFSVPSRWIEKWSWENMWLVWSVCALLLFPISLLMLAVPRVGEVLVQEKTVAEKVASAGMIWGISQVMFGLSLQRIGMTLTFSIVLGISSALGSLIPFFYTQALSTGTRPVFLLCWGLALVLTSVILSARAGLMRDRAAASVGAESRFYLGLLTAIVSGMCASAMNVGFALGQPLTQLAHQRGVAPLWSTAPVWAVLLGSGSIPNILYCFYLFLRRGSGIGFYNRNLFRNTGLAGLMAALWYSSSLVYGQATLVLGALGPVVGWPAFMSCIMIAACLLGILTGEWRKGPRIAVVLQSSAILSAIAAVIALSHATM